MFVRGHLSPAALDRLIAEQSSQALTYSEVGATRGRLPDGYRQDEHRMELGRGSRAFERAAAGLRQWEAHRGAGLTVHPDVPRLSVGTNVAVVLALPLITAVAVCRIVLVVDEPDAFGFAYGTLPAHPERGEEAFFVERDGDGVVWFRIRAFSRPRHPLARLGGPVARRVQVTTTRRYMEALQDFVSR